MGKKIQSFGEFIRVKREALGKTIRGFASELNITPAYLSDIEKENRQPPEKYLEAIAAGLHITGDELNLYYDLAGADRKGNFTDINEYISGRKVARVALRTARDYKITDKQWEAFIEDIKKNNE